MANQRPAMGGDPEPVRLKGVHFARGLNMESGMAANRPCYRRGN